MAVVLFAFLGWLVVSIASSLVLSQSLDKIGARFGLSPGTLGFVTALGADAPEIAAVVSAIAAGHHDLGMGVIFGSNIFNLAGLLGLGAVLAGRVSIGRQGMILEGLVALVATSIGIAVTLDALSGTFGLVALGVLLLAFQVLMSLRPGVWKWLSIFGVDPARFMVEAAAEAEHAAREEYTPPRATGTDVLTLVPAIVAIVVASFGMVRLAVDLAGHFHWPHVVIGALVLATLTGIPNVLAAVRLAIHGRGSAVVSETLNSNSVNILAGICLPAVVVGTHVPTTLAVVSAWWLLAMTAVAVVLSCRRGGLARLGGASLMVVYGAYVVLVCAWRS
ncbi:MAG TPA: hypothetical protein VHZ24_04050 [Pirellulales bacterium]|nr:hypothetical protein [Pirellulales bacterium]